ncbi:uncharacterized protein LOC121776245 [Salvia splendens]|uniref:uncharacterized protein LOC121776245 n=1 Tax=Salvia splendens TaxID=180675 RepID=UPI001C27EECB|nr:uncharacterized protein LOC121776245 [Salvia splendens]
MAVGATRKISAASARAHTENPTPKLLLKFQAIISFPQFARSHFYFFRINEILDPHQTTVSWLVGFLAWAYQAVRPPPPKTSGLQYGPPVTASRVQLKDGRYLAYKESGVPKDVAKHKIVFIHGFDNCRHHVSAMTANLSPDIVESRGIYIVSFDRPGYGKSSLHPTRTVKSLAFDIEELADQLELQPKFYIIGFSMGGQVVWSCLKYIPHRLAGAALLTPVVIGYEETLTHGNNLQQVFNRIIYLLYKSSI